MSALPAEDIHPGSAPNLNKMRGFLILAAILCIALLLRCTMLSKESLWIDESASWRFASGDLSQALKAEPTNPPLYYVLLHFWINWFGASESALRSLSVLPSMGSVWLIYMLTKRLFSPSVAGLAALYQAVSSFQIFYAQEARTFSLLTFFLLAGTLLLWNALESPPGIRRILGYIGYTVVMALALYSHFIATFFLAAHGVYVLFRHRRQILYYAASAVVVVLLFLPWLLVLLRAAAGGGQAGRRYFLLKLPQAYFSFLFGDTLIPLDEAAVTHIRETLSSSAPLLLVAILSAAILGLFLVPAWKRWGDALSYTAVMATVPVLLAFVVSFKVMVFDERYLIGASPFTYVLVAAAMMEVLLEWQKRQQAREGAGAWRIRAGLGAIAAYALLLAVSLQHYYFNPRFGKEEWREAIAYLEGAASPRDWIILDPDYLHSCYDYYQKRGLPYWAVTGQISSDVAASPAAISGRAAGHGRVWLVTAHYDNGIVQHTLENLFPERSRRDYSKGHGIEVQSFAVSGD
jgi:mannosyltransferase